VRDLAPPATATGGLEERARQDGLIVTLPRSQDALMTLLDLSFSCTLTTELPT
jgi:hypothetical protein